MEIQYHELDRQQSDWIGSGGFGRVFEVTYKKRRVACKILKHAIHPSIFYKEIHIMQCLGRHACIVNLIGYIHEKEKDEFMCIVMERAQGIPLSCGIMYHDMTDLVRRKISVDIIDTLAYIHRHKIIYRDLKPENIILNMVHWSIQFVDFGSAIRCTDEENIRGIVGTPGYMAPEVCRNDPYTYTADIFSYGMTLFVLWMQHEPCRLSQVQRILRHRDSVFHDIILTALHPIAAHRPSAAGILATLEDIRTKKKSRTFNIFSLFC